MFLRKSMVYHPKNSIFSRREYSWEELNKKYHCINLINRSLEEVIQEINDLPPDPDTALRFKWNHITPPSNDFFISVFISVPSFVNKISLCDNALFRCMSLE